MSFPEQIVESDYELLKNVVQPKLWYILQEKVWCYKTNALNAMLNAYKHEYLPFIQEACDDKNENVRKMVKRLTSNCKVEWVTLLAYNFL